MPDNNELSEREREILYLVATGASNKEIANTLYISTNTVKVHLKNIFAKIDVTSRTEAAMYAVNIGLVAPASTGQTSDRTAIVDAEKLTETEGIDVSSKGLRSAWSQRWFWIAGAVVIGLVALGFILRGIIPQPAAGRTPAVPAVTTNLPRWQTKSPMLTGRSGLGVAAFGGQIYAIAGEAEQGVTSVTELYDPDDDKWASLPEKPTAVKDVSAAVIGGKIYVPGGVLQNGTVTDKLEIFNPAEAVWESGAPLPVPLSRYALAPYEGKLYIFGGWDGVQIVASVFEYAPDLNCWVEKSAMPTARAFAGAAVAIGRIFVIGGNDGQKPLAVNEVYQPDLDIETGQGWSEAAAMPTPREGMGVAGVADIIHVIGGQGSDGEFTSLGYIPENDAWQPIEAYEELGSQMGVAGLGEYLYIIGGKLEEHPVDTALAYRAIYTVSIPVIINNQP